MSGGFRIVSDTLVYCVIFAEWINDRRSAASSTSTPNERHFHINDHQYIANSYILDVLEQIFVFFTAYAVVAFFKRSLVF